MQHLKNFVQVQPTEEQREEYAIEGRVVLFLQSEDGSPWYESQSLFADDTIKIMYDEKGVIRSVVDEPVYERGGILAVSMFFPVGMSVVEIDGPLPEGFGLGSGTWYYIDGNVLQIIDYVADAERYKRKQMTVATTAIAPLQDAVDLGKATEDEIERLTGWKQYRLALSRIDTAQAPDIVWPEPPQI